MSHNGIPPQAAVDASHPERADACSTHCLIVIMLVIIIIVIVTQGSGVGIIIGLSIVIPLIGLTIWDFIRRERKKTKS